MPSPLPTLTLSRTSATSYSCDLTFPAGYTCDLYVRTTDNLSSQYYYFGSISASGVINVTGRNAYSYQQAFAVTKDPQGSISLPAFSSVDLNQPDSILSAIKSKWYSDSALLAKFPGGLFANEAPESIDKKALVMPYVIVRDSDRDFTFLMESLYFEGTNLDFICFAPGAFLADECIDLIRSRFDWKPITFKQGTTKSVSVQPVKQAISSENFRYKDGNLIYRGSVTYDIIVTRTL